MQALAKRIEARPHAAGLREARQLVFHVTGLSPTAQIGAGQDQLPAEDIAALNALVARRCAGEPLARLTGKAAFWDFEVGLNAATLIPRDDSAVLVETALDFAPADTAICMVDLGTGSGIIALALAKELPLLTGLGIDVAGAAVAMAKANAHSLGLSDQLTFQTGSWLDGVDERFDLIVSNPPYITLDEMTDLAVEVREHDPKTALVAGPDGLDAYRALLPQSASALRPGGYVMVEIGARQSAAVRALGEQAGLVHVATRCDLAGHDRVVAFTL